MAIDDNTLYGLTGAQVKELPGRVEAVKGLARELTVDDYNWPTVNPDGVALWLLPDGLYTGVATVYTASNYKVTSGHLYIVATSDIGNNRRTIVYLDEGSSGYPAWKTTLVGATDGQFYGNIPVPIINDTLTSSSTKTALSANQGSVLKGLIDNVTPSTSSSAPTTSTVGSLGKIRIDTTNNDAYMCVEVDSVTPAYTWKKLTP